MPDLSTLNPQQREAVEHTEGPLLVLAGAGSGKTRVITFRIAHLLALGVPPERILALSFTNKAAGEMRERVGQMVGKRARAVVLSTFHALGVIFLKEEALHVGRAPGFTILDEADQLDAVRRGLQQLGFDPERYDPRAVYARISHYKTLLQEPDARLGGLDAVTAHVLPLYEQRLVAMNAVDFDDLIGLPVRAMERMPEIAERWGRRFRYIMVDEYQDTNGAQLRMVRGLSRGFGNVCVVGDDDQSIYGWRGAVADNILRFDQQFPGARLIALTQNYRSTNHILRAANHLIRNNIERHDKALWSQLGEGPLLRYQVCAHDDEEAEWIASDLLGYHGRHDLHWRQMAVLYRTNAQSRSIEAALRAAAIPYRVVGGAAFYDRKEVRDVIAYLRVIANPYDEAAWRRILNYPQRGVGDLSVQRLFEASLSEAQPVAHLLQQVQQLTALSPRVRTILEGFVGDLERFRQRFHTEHPAEVCRDLITHFGFADEILRTYKQASQVRRRIENVQELASDLRSFLDRNPEAGLHAFLARMSLDTRREEAGAEDADEVNLMTLHASKGLEFEAVWLCGFEKKLLPHQRTPGGPVDLPEERRLAYVGLTRAKKHLTLTRAAIRLKFGRPQRCEASPFLEEIPADLFYNQRTGEVPAVSAVEQQAHARRSFAAMSALLSDEALSTAPSPAGDRS